MNAARTCSAVKRWTTLVFEQGITLGILGLLRKFLCCSPSISNTHLTAPTWKAKSTRAEREGFADHSQPVHETGPVCVV